MTDSYDDTYRQSLENPQRFWAVASQDIEWVRRPRAVIDDSTPPKIRWFPGAVLNTCFNAVDLHVLAGRGDQIALIYDSPVTGTARSFSYSELQDEVSRTAGALASLGVERGDRVLLYMPMIPEAVIGMLAAARLGAIHSVVFGGFAASELAQRIQHSEPKVILTASCGIEPGRVVSYLPLLESALEKVSNKPAHCVVVNRPEQTATLRAGRDLDWEEITQSAKPHPCVPVQASEPLYILYTSGTTGSAQGRRARQRRPRRRPQVEHAEHLRRMKAGDVFWAASDIGWVVGHSYIVYAPLAAGLHFDPVRGQASRDAGCGGLLAGGRPARRQCSLHRTDGLSSHQARGSRRQKLLTQDYDLSSLRTLFLAGERADPDTVEWCRAARLKTCRSSTIGGKPRRAGPSPSNCMGIEAAAQSSVARPRSSRARLCPARFGRRGQRAFGGKSEPDEGIGQHRREAPPSSRLSIATLWHNDEGFERSSYLVSIRGLLPDRGCGAFRRGRLPLGHGQNR